MSKTFDIYDQALAYAISLSIQEKRQTVIYKRSNTDLYFVDLRKAFFNSAPCNPIERHKKYIIFAYIDGKDYI